MPRLVYSWKVLLAGFVLGALLPQRYLFNHFVGGVIFSVLALLVYLVYASLRHDYLLKKRGFLRSEATFIDVILQLVAAAAKVDGKVMESERARIRIQLEAAYSTEKAKRYLIAFETYLNQPIPIRKLCKTIDEEFDNATKGHLLYLLVSIVTADGLLTLSEAEFIRKIAYAARIRPTTVNSVYRLFSFRQEEQRQQQQQQQSKRPAISPTSLAAAYNLLGITASSTEKEVKKAFRQLAKIHHPDKLSHLGNEQMELANEKFQTILAAYERIKLSKGIQ